MSYFPTLDQPTDSASTVRTTPPLRRSTPLALGLVSLWRLVFAGVAWWGAYAGLHRGEAWRITNLYFWSQLSTLTVALVATGSLLSPLWCRGALEGRRGFLRGAAVTYTSITLVLFPVLLGGSYSNLDSRLMHLWVPVLAIVDWVLVGRNQGRLGWYWPVVWLAVPLAYLPFYIARSNATRALYPFLDPSRSNFVQWVLILFAAFLAAGYLWWAVGRTRELFLSNVHLAEQRSTRRI